ncbi:hypothetical protein [Paludibacterium denitrificans]|uniref:Phage tail tape measure protein n=1 Tax=Paludibacterium denitrificans TaxID=2675226 RepID=A0A844GE48_9NEIS|nr:hypothetical protein [Paludibacterium denitrificans]MTD34032.1 hypothetical protein [Paludibacterium denitrificans]
MAIDLATLGFGVETADLERAAKILDSVTESAGRAGKAAKGMASDATSGMDGFTSSSQKASHAAQQYLQSLQKQYDMLGKNRMETAALQAAYMGFNSEVQKQAAAIGAQIDAWHRNEEAAKAAAKAQDAAFRGSKPGADEAAGFMAKLGLNTA